MSNLGTAPQQHENRREARISYRLEFTAGDVTLSSSNISKGGTQLCCPSMRYAGLAAGISQGQTRLAWKIPGSNEIITSLAAIRYANKCDDEILIGMEVVEFPAGQQAVWADFIDNLAATREASTPI